MLFFQAFCWHLTCSSEKKKPLQSTVFSPCLVPISSPSLNQKDERLFHLKKTIKLNVLYTKFRKTVFIVGEVKKTDFTAPPKYVSCNYFARQEECPAGPEDIKITDFLTARENLYQRHVGFPGNRSFYHSLRSTEEVSLSTSIQLPH